MSDIPNFKKIYESAQQLDQEYNLESRLKRYSTVNPELIKSVSNFGLENEQDITRALFVADYIVTSSEVTGGTDQDRYKSIFECFKKGLSTRTENSDSLMRIFYLSLKTGQLIRQNDLFMAGRGLKRIVGLLLIKDAFLNAYLAVSSEILGVGKCGWELALLSASLKKTYPHKEMLEYKEAPEHTNSELFPISWRMLLNYLESFNVEVNDNLVIPNITETQVIFIAHTTRTPLLSVWNLNYKAIKGEKKVIDSLLKYLDRSDSDKSLIYLRGKIIGSDERFMFVRNPFAINDSKPLIMIKTPAEEINLTEMLFILKQRGSELQEWQKMKEPKELSHNLQEKKVPTKITKPGEIPAGVKKENLFSKVKSFFNRLFQKSPNQSQEKKPHIDKLSTPDSIKKKINKYNYLPTFLSHAIGVEAVGDFNILDIFDSYRESEYLVIGALESSFKNNKTHFATRSIFGDPSALEKVLDGLDQVLEQAANVFFQEEHQILPTEILFTTKNDDRYIICLNGNEERLVGTIAMTYLKGVSEMQTENESEETVKRRTLHMRTNQLLNSLRHSHFDEAVHRIYGDAVNDSVQFITLDHPILPL